MEEKTNTKLVIRRTARSSRGNIYTYVCQHSRGTDAEIDPKELKRRYTKRKHVVKNCSAFAKVHVRGDGFIELHACFDHIGHVSDNAWLPLTADDRTRVKSLIEEGVPPSLIVSKLRSEHWDENLSHSMQARICYLTTRDVSRIAEQNGLLHGQYRRNDLDSLKMLMSQSPDIAKYRLVFTENATGDGFIAAFVTSTGQKHLELYSHRGIVFDDTFNVSRYALRLATLLVSDDAGNGFPCAHLLAFRMTSAEIAILFELIKECVPQFDPSIVMTDDTYIFYNGFKTVFPNSRAAKVLCSFHVSQTVLRKHKELLNKCDISTAERLFHATLFEMNPVKFENNFCVYTTWLNSIGAKKMVDYIEKNLRGRQREWALCYRRGAQFTTTNHAESFHNTLKHVLLQSKQNSRLDAVVYTLLRNSSDRELHLIAMNHKHENPSKRQKQNISAHKDALRLYTGVPGAIKQISSTKYKVLSFLGVAKPEYEVTITEEPCDCNEKLNSHCARCGACYKRIFCECRESYKSGVSCLHSHALATFSEQVRNILQSQSQHSMRSTFSSGAPLQALPPSLESENDPADFISAAPEDVLRKDDVKELFQVFEGTQAHLAEIARRLLKENRADLLKDLNNNLERVTQEVPEDINPALARRLPMQVPGTGKKPSLIQPFKTRTKLKAEARERRQFKDLSNTNC
ncbi:unnamed protein product [Cylicocyclus nassatus]|uniref:MULE transposase domain-containing protein n=1 Tax=Cylicocyclus nassatus TaxID=53992 RepID=A0AA36GHX7_CYLNA|nr:unnamed protein product [Cylicocyclus nassatus]